MESAGVEVGSRHEHPTRTGMRVLIVEDEQKAADNLKLGLEQHAYLADVAYDAESAAELAQSRSYDLMILDVMLPGMDGWSLLGKLRRVQPDAHVLFLTALDTVPDRVRGLDLGADDYLVKPVDLSELLARLRAIVRRGAGRELRSLSIADLQLDLTRRIAMRAGQPLELTPKEFMLLALLVRHAGEPLSRAVIADQVWNMDVTADSNVVDVHVRRLRAKLDDPFATRLLHTVRGIGYVVEERS